MVPDAEGLNVVLELDFEEVERILWGTALAFLVLDLIVLVGEFLGWWNEAGEVALTVFTIIVGMASLMALATGATRRGARPLGAGIERANLQLDGTNATLTRMDRTLGAMDTRLRTMGGTLGKLDKLERLERLDELQKLGQLQKLDQLDKLDVVQAELDEQTGVMGRQVAILEQIRDRL